MTMHYGAGPRVGVVQAARTPHAAARIASVQVLPASRPAGETAAAWPTDLVAGRLGLSGLGSLRLSGLGSLRLTGRPAVFVLASLVVALLASSAAPTPLYGIYQAQWHFTPITTTVVFGVYEIGRAHV